MWRMSLILHPGVVLAGRILLSELPTCLMARRRSNSTWNGKARQKSSEEILGAIGKTSVRLVLVNHLITQTIGKQKIHFLQLFILALLLTKLLLDEKLSVIVLFSSQQFDVHVDFVQFLRHGLR